MSKSGHYKLMIMAVAIAFAIAACASVDKANVQRVDTSREKELRQNWKNYTIYTRSRDGKSKQPGPAAVLYKIKNDKKIILNNRWQEVTTAEGAANARVSERTTVVKILGQNEEVYGYLVHRTADSASVRIVDDQTVQLGYAYRRDYSN